MISKFKQMYDQPATALQPQLELKIISAVKDAAADETDDVADAFSLNIAEEIFDQLSRHFL